jgi:hypothetical protein
MPWVLTRVRVLATAYTDMVLFEVMNSGDLLYVLRYVEFSLPSSIAPQ